MRYNQNLTVRVDDSLAETVDQLLGLTAKRSSRDRSRLIRQILGREASYWLDSPYVALKQQSFFFVNAQGDVYFHSIQLLELKHSRINLPCHLEMKPEKQAEFLRRDDNASNLKTNWIVNNFAVWADEDRRDLIVEGSDSKGGSSKIVDLEINRPQDTTIVREVTGGIRDYVQRQELSASVIAEDRGEVPVEVPTLDLEAAVIVDKALYGRSILASTARVDREFRNLESAKLYLKEFAHSEEPIHWTADRAPRARYKGRDYPSAKKDAEDAFNRLSRALARINDTDPTSQSPAIEMPKEYLFGRLKWRMPHFGLKLCLTWNKPEPKEAS